MTPHDYDPILREIEEGHVLTVEERKDQDEEDREEKETEQLLESLRRGTEEDARRWAAYEKLHGPLLEPAALERFPEGHPHAGFARTVNVTACERRGQKCLKETEKWRQDRDEWIVRVIGPFYSRRKSKRRRAEEEMDPERQRRS